MTNDKFTLQRDRRLVLDDEKNRIIDLRDFHVQPPDVGIYDEPVRYFKANKQWCKFIFGWLTWMQSVSFWEDAEDSNYHAIQQILIFEEGINGTILMNPDEFRDALDAGMYSAFNKLARQIVSGRYTDIAVDEDGNVSQPSDSPDAGLPEDDPDTLLDESLAARAGGAIAVADGIQQMLTTVETWRLAPLSVDVQKTRFKLLYLVNAAEADAFIDYYNGITPPHPGQVDLLAALDGMLFCQGVSVQTLADYAYTVHTPSGDIGIIESLIPALTQEQLDAWFERGLEVPSSDYQSYSCTKIPEEEFTLDMSTANAPSYVTNGVWKAGHRYLIEISGSYVDSDVPNIVGDGMYFHDTSTGIKTFSTMNFNFDGSISVPTQANVPFSPAHTYAFTIERNIGSGNATRTISRDNGTMNLPNVTGILTIKITDLGEFAI